MNALTRPNDGDTHLLLNAPSHVHVAILHACICITHITLHKTNPSAHDTLCDVLCYLIQCVPGSPLMHGPRCVEACMQLLQDPGPSLTACPYETRAGHGLPAVHVWVPSGASMGRLPLIGPAPRRASWPLMDSTNHNQIQRTPNLRIVLD